ncbi:endo-alpha-N-acetylgalactosaminidase family protein [Bifidobacterium sp. M0353]|uniref:endo-alpha-N-acetylgalactosaminidase family protein n=1 Tax=Bifidobacterium sp. M0353 TaxID=2751006 RepID=UPI0018DC704B|nr:endo-alpha-N-acetylgalactosaminidase family protein [Bifidobacterium sp. M0353]MBI0150808.1 discoidin domain-containing protein [Bifidobacterium sp. M0353]
MKRIISMALATVFALATAGAADPAFATTGSQPYHANAPSTLATGSGTKTRAAGTNPRITPVNPADHKWTLDSSTTKGGEVLEKSNGWLHFKASAANGNSTTASEQYPAIALDATTYDFTSPGALTLTMSSPQPGTENRFGFYLGYANPNSGLFIGYDSGGWFWQRYGGDGQWYTGTRLPAPAQDTPTTIGITWTGQRAGLTVDGRAAFEDVDYGPMAGALTGRLAMKAGVYQNQITDVKLKLKEDPADLHSVVGRIVDADGGAIAGAKVHLTGASTLTDVEGAFTLEQIKSGRYTLQIGKQGYEDVTKDIQVDRADLNLGSLQLNKATPEAKVTLSTPEMSVQVRKHFPSVVQYTMTKLDNRVMYGRHQDLRRLNINGIDMDLTDSDVTFTQQGTDKATYQLHARMPDQNIDATVTAVLWLKANTLHLDITKIENGAGEDHPIQTIALPGQDLVSVSSDQDGAQFTGARMSSNTQVPGDTTFPITDDTAVDPNKADYTYGFVSGGSLSAGLWSNSEHDGTTAGSSMSGGARNTRVLTDVSSVHGSTSLGLSSPAWYYHRQVRDSKNRSFTVAQTEMPKMAVAITGDENQDGRVDWQDGAIAYRAIMNNPYGAQEVPDLVSWRIAMNFGSQAQNPFLSTLDNVKKVDLNTDGLGQSVLLKGYANEGHDSGHPDYGDIGTRMGGAKDMNTLMKEGAKHGARFGVHVNADEMYPEAKAFNEDLVRRRADGSLQYGWNWLDQAVGIDGIHDLASGSRQSRFGELKKKVGDNLDFVYVDVWGNQTSGSEDSWETRKLSKMITDNGWRVATEFGAANEYDASFQHWAADLTYGGYTSKGQNSQVMRFLRNHQKDSWDGDYPSYGGAANAPLLGGYSMKDFEGWQGRNDYDAYIANLYTHDLSTKFIQHFMVTRWVNNPLDQQSPKDPSANNGQERIILKDDLGHQVIIDRGSNDQSSSAYRERTITLDGRTILQGAVSPGDGSGQGTESYLLPWLWDAKTGKPLSVSNQKLYHWNTRGGTTTWTLPDSWHDLSAVKVYRLSDQGKTDPLDIPVVNGQITLNAKAETPYVVHRGASANPDISWSTGSHLVDTGFNGGKKSLEDNWQTKGSGSATIVKSASSNPMLKLDGRIESSQTIKDLEPGARYALYVGVDNRSDGQARLEVRSGDQVLATNSTGRSIARNFVQADPHNTNCATVDGSSLFQNMYVFFTAPDQGNPILTLSHQGEGSAYFDNLRLVKNGYQGLETDADGGVKTLTNDFEHNAQGIWPFVVSGAEGVEDNRVHLSELHAPYTQAGWDVKKMDDVLQGDWSIKINGLTERNTLVYQTIPQNARFLTGATYRISFDYQAGSTGSYALAIGQGEFDPARTQLKPLEKALGTTAHYQFELTGGPRDSSWFGIYSTDKAPDRQGTSGDAANFGGYQDFVLDNLRIERLPDTSKTQEEARAKLKQVRDRFDDSRAKYSDQAWLTYLHTVDQARLLIEKDGSGPKDWSHAYGILTALEDYMATAPGSQASDGCDIAKDKYAVSAGSEQPDAGGVEGPKEYAQDGKPSTYWHTKWGANALEDGSAWYQFDLQEPTTVNGLRYLPRPGGDSANGKIKGYKITLTRSGQSEPVEITGTFDTQTTWQKISFTPVSNVIRVRLTAIETTGQSSSEANHYVSAAELRLTTDCTLPTLAEPVDKGELQDLVNQAAGLKEADYTPDSWKTLQDKLATAKQVLADEQATAYQVALAAANLQTAISKLQPAIPGTGIGGIGSGSDTGKNPITGTGNGSGLGGGKGNTQQKPTHPNAHGQDGWLSATGVAVTSLLVVVMLGLTTGLLLTRRSQGKRS